MEVGSRNTPFNPNLDDPSSESRYHRRIQPWIRRELEVPIGFYLKTSNSFLFTIFFGHQALIPESVDDLLVHFVVGVWLAHIRSIQSKKRKGLGGREGSQSQENDCIQELERFLGGKSELFWHELK